MSRSCDVRWDWGLVWVLVWLHMQNRVAFLEVLLHCLPVNCEDKVALCVSILFHRLINLTSKVIKKKKKSHQGCYVSITQKLLMVDIE